MPPASSAAIIDSMPAVSSADAARSASIVIKAMREDAKVADDHEDPGTVDMFSKFVQVHEKHEWWLRDMLRTGDGLSSGWLNRASRRRRSRARARSLTTDIHA